MAKFYQKKILKKSHQLWPGLGALVLIIFLILTGKVISFWERLSQPFSPDSPFKITKPYLWDGSSVLTLAVKADELYLLSLDGKDQSLKILKIPNQTYLNLPFGYGSYLASSIYDLGQAEKNPMGARLLKETASFSLGIPVDDYLLLPKNLFKETFDKLIQENHNNPLVFWQIIKNSKTDLSLSELVNLYFKMAKIRADKIKIWDIEENNLAQEKRLADESLVLNLNPLNINKFVQEQFEDAQISLEGQNIGIFNSTDHPQMAERAAKLITNLGGRVIFTANLPNHQEKSLIIGKDSYSKTRLSQIFAPQCLVNVCSLESQEADFSRSDLSIILGEDYFLKFNRP